MVTPQVNTWNFSIDMLPKSCRPALFFLFFLTVFVGCGGDPGPQNGVIADDPGLSSRIEEFTGAPTRIVWSQHQNPDASDTLLNGSQHALLGIDTSDGKGIRLLAEDRDNYARPLISPDGQEIIFSRKHYERDENWKRNWKPEIYRTDWTGSPPEKIADGYAVDFVDDAQGRTWVYAVTDIPDTEKSLFLANKVIRFPLDEPEAIETVWDQSPVTPDNFQLSGDLTRAASLFPWPAMGYIDFDQNDWFRLSGGCWASISPDNSYLTWVLDGAHKTIRMFSPTNPQGWAIPLSQIPGIDGHQAYHPRWSNHPRYMVFTGPYLRMPDGGNPITRSGPTAEVILGRFSEQFDKLDSVLIITDNHVGDFYPDLWVAGGDQASPANLQATPTGNLPPTEAEAQWPPPKENLTFLWTRSASRNRVSENGVTRTSRAEARERARPWRDGAMDVRGGYFEADVASAEKSIALFNSEGAFTIELLVYPESLPTGHILHGGPVAIRHDENKILLTDGTSAVEAFVQPGPFHLAVRRQDGQLEIFIDGKLATTSPAAPTSPREGELHFGSDGWEGFLRAIAISSRPFTDNEIAGHAQFWKQAEEANTPVERLRVRAALQQATPVPSIESLADEPYARALVAHTWKITDVIEGDPAFQNQEILVLHWAVLDQKPVQVPATEPGDEVELELELAEDHPELASERLFDASSNFDLEVFYDINTPQPAP